MKENTKALPIGQSRIYSATIQAPNQLDLPGYCRLVCSSPRLTRQKQRDATKASTSWCRRARAADRRRPETGCQHWYRGATTPARPCSLFLDEAICQLLGARLQGSSEVQRLDSGQLRYLTTLVQYEIDKNSYCRFQKCVKVSRLSS